MKENKKKGIARDKIEEEAINQSHPPVSSKVKVIPHASSKQKNMVSKRADTRKLPSRRGD